MRERRQVSNQERAGIRHRLGRLLAQREEIRFACLHGSFLEPGGFRDVDVGVYVDPRRVCREAAPDYELRLSGWVERSVSHPIDARVLNYAPLGFQYMAVRGELIFARDQEEWFAFRERTWRDYMDFAPLAKEALLDLLRARP